MITKSFSCLYTQGFSPSLLWKLIFLAILKVSDFEMTQSEKEAVGGKGEGAVREQWPGTRE